MWVPWNVSKQSFPNNGLYSSEEEALDYAGRIQTAQALQVEAADEYAVVELPGPSLKKPGKADESAALLVGPNPNGRGRGCSWPGRS